MLTQPEVSLSATDAPATISSSVIDWTDKAAFTFFFVALALPFEQIVFVPLGVFAASAFEFVYLVVGALLCFKILIQAKINHPFFSLITVSSFITYILFPLALGEAAFSDSVMQMRTDYFPFLLAILWLMAGTQATVRGFFRNLLVAAACGAGSALAIQHLFPSYVQRLAAGDAGSIGNLFHIAVAGRLWWPNEFTITLFVLLYFTVRDRHSRVGWPLALTALALTLAAAFNTLSRTLLLGIFFILVGSLFTGRGWRELRRRVFQLALASGLLGTFIAILLAYDEKVRNLVDARFFGRGAGIAAIYAIDLQLGRFSLYKQYWEDIQKSFPIGMDSAFPLTLSMPVRR